MVQMYKIMCDEASDTVKNGSLKWKMCTRRDERPALCYGRREPATISAVASLATGYRVADVWNGLPRLLKEAGNAGQFKNRYRALQKHGVAPT
jgi:hypothetical protein